MNKVSRPKLVKIEKSKIGEKLKIFERPNINEKPNINDKSNNNPKSEICCSSIDTDASSIVKDSKHCRDVAVQTSYRFLNIPSDKVLECYIMTKIRDDIIEGETDDNKNEKTFDEVNAEFDDFMSEIREDNSKEEITKVAMDLLKADPEINEVETLKNGDLNNGYVKIVKSPSFDSNDETKIKADVETESDVVDEDKIDVDVKENLLPHEKSNLVEEKSNIVEKKSNSVEEKSNSVEEKSNSVEEKSNIVKEKFNIVEGILDNVEEKVDIIEEKMDIVEERMDIVDEKVDIVGEKIDIMEEKVLIVDVRLDIVQETLDYLQGKFDNPLKTNLKESNEIENKDLKIGETVEIKSNVFDEDKIDVEVKEKLQNNDLDTVNVVEMFDEKLNIVEEILANVEEIEERIDIVEEKMDMVEEKMDIVGEKIDIVEEKIDIAEEKVLFVEEKLDVVQDKMNYLRRKRFENQLENNLKESNEIGNKDLEIEETVQIQSDIVDEDKIHVDVKDNLQNNDLDPVNLVEMFDEKLNIVDQKLNMVEESNEFECKADVIKDEPADDSHTNFEIEKFDAIENAEKSELQLENVTLNTDEIDIVVEEELKKIITKMLSVVREKGDSPDDLHFAHEIFKKIDQKLKVPGISYTSLFSYFKMVTRIIGDFIEIPDNRGLNNKPLMVLLETHQKRKRVLPESDDTEVLDISDFKPDVKRQRVGENLNTISDEEKNDVKSDNLEKEEVKQNLEKGNLTENGEEVDTKLTNTFIEFCDNLIDISGKTCVNETENLIKNTSPENYCTLIDRRFSEIHSFVPVTKSTNINSLRQKLTQLALILKEAPEKMQNYSQEVVKPASMFALKSMVTKAVKIIHDVESTIINCKHKVKPGKNQICNKGMCKNCPRIENVISFETVKNILGKGKGRQWEQNAQRAELRNVMFDYNPGPSRYNPRYKSKNCRQFKVYNKNQDTKKKNVTQSKVTGQTLQPNQALELNQTLQSNQTPKCNGTLKTIETKNKVDELFYKNYFLIYKDYTWEGKVCFLCSVCADGMQNSHNLTKIAEQPIRLLCSKCKNKIIKDGKIAMGKFAKYDFYTNKETILQLENIGDLIQDISHYKNGDKEITNAIGMSERCLTLLKEVLLKDCIFKSCLRCLHLDNDHFHQINNHVRISTSILQVNIRCSKCKNTLTKELYVCFEDCLSIKHSFINQLTTAYLKNKTAALANPDESVCKIVRVTPNQQRLELFGDKHTILACWRYPIKYGIIPVMVEVQKNLTIKCTKCKYFIVNDGVLLSDDLIRFKTSKLDKGKNPKIFEIMLRGYEIFGFYTIKGKSKDDILNDDSIEDHVQDKNKEKEKEETKMEDKKIEGKKIQNKKKLGKKNKNVKAQDKNSNKGEIESVFPTRNVENCVTSFKSKRLQNGNEQFWIHLDQECDSSIETQKTKENQEKQMQLSTQQHIDNMAGGDFNLPPNSENYRAVIESENHFFRGDLSHNAAFVQSTNVTFVVKENEEAKPEDWMGYDKAEF